MIFLKQIAIIFFNLIDKFLHQKKILRFLIKERIQINTWIDVGSHRGLYTDLIKDNFKIKKGYLFEPQREIYNLIKKKYKNSRNIYPYNYAISNKKKSEKIYINKHDLTSSLTKINEENLYLKLKSRLFGGNSLIVKSCVVQTIKLENFISKKKLKRVDLLKIDTEGHEYQVLQGLGKKINKVKIILIEFHNDKIYKNYNSKKIHKYLIKKNFDLKTRIKFPFTEWEDRIYLSNKN